MSHTIGKSQGVNGLTPISIGDPDKVQSWPWDKVKVNDRRGEPEPDPFPPEPAEPKAKTYFERDNDLEKAVKRTELIKQRMSAAGSLGLPALLDQVRLDVGIPDDAWRYQAVFDRVHVFQVDLEVKDEKFTGSSLWKPNRSQQIDKDEAHSGILISAGLVAADQLSSHGIELGHKVGFLRNAPFRHLFARFDDFNMYYLVLRCGDLTSSETLATELRAGSKKIVDEGGDTYIHNYDGKKKKSVFISDHW